MPKGELIEFAVRTEQGRTMSYHAANADEARRYAEQNGHLPISIMPYKEARGR